MKFQTIKNIPGNMWDMVKKYPKTSATLALAGFVAGTYSGNEGGLPPIYANKVGLSNGLNINVVTNFNKGSTTNGLSLSLVSIDNGGTINVGDFSLFKYYGVESEEDAGKINGLEFSLLRIPKNGTDSYPVVQGWQIGLFNNLSRNGNVFQSGIYNSVKLENSNIKRGLLFNHKFGKGRKVPGKE